MSTRKDEAPTLAGDEASVSNLTSHRKTDMNDFNASSPEPATVDALTIVTASEIATFAPELTIENGQITTTSIQISQHFSKRHGHTLRAIANLESWITGPIFHRLGVMGH